MSAVSFTALSKVYRHYASPRDRLWELFGRSPRHVPVWALRDVTGEVEKGAALGLVGENGSGKSTLLKILAGTTSPTSGEARITGRVASILELGSAFHPEVSGRRNAVLQAALSGLSASEIDAALPEIEAFAELGDFFDRPVKTYSSGMSMRLAFAVATTVLPDVVLLDEALAVGDGRFQKKCVDRIFELKSSGRTIVFCSHAMYYVSTLCDRALWLSGGTLMALGDAQAVVLEYESFLARKGRSDPAPEVRPDSHGRLTAVRVLDAEGRPREQFVPGEPWCAELELAVDSRDRPVQVHLAVSTPDNVVCFSADTRLSGFGPLVGRERYRVRVSVGALPLAKGEFVVHAYVGDENSLALYDARSDTTFRVEADRWVSGLMAVPSSWERLE